MQTYIHVRLDPTRIRSDLYRDAQLRSRVLCERIRSCDPDTLRKLSLRRACRRKPDPPYVPFCIAVDAEVIGQLQHLPANASVSALAQHLLSPEFPGRRK
ncbi:hypothetical protein [Acidithiobacillus thiooxidans]|uniref:Uncharacterized protein n=1 Tax=Acidithiobacillus thiooxidans TaxID=930 RepID=A0A1C2IVR1_ACITH|nr:hypothetical protein [Acidithiobacillus thiooxidans]OCX68121.1 hypothetical protein A6M23_18915 [Acidithiobacillus thiooxidans]OCX80037.1 hypothetical protein A6P08_17145 [Acidithiobacillus thiooxidans]